jgi:hypothetical protein
MPAADLTKWPHNPRANLVDTHPNWREVFEFTNWPITKLRQVSVEKLEELSRINVFEQLEAHTQDAILRMIDGLPPVDNEVTIHNPERLTSLAESATNAEVARASIDANALFKMAALAVTTGDLCGAQLQAKERIDLLKWLGNKVVPDARSIDSADTAKNIDRTRKQKFNADDLRNLNRQELLDLLQATPTTE